MDKVDTTPPIVAVPSASIPPTTLNEPVILGVAVVPLVMNTPVPGMFKVAVPVRVAVLPITMIPLDETVSVLFAVAVLLLMASPSIDALVVDADVPEPCSVLLPVVDKVPWMEGVLDPFACRTPVAVLAPVADALALVFPILLPTMVAVKVPAGITMPEPTMFAVIVALITPSRLIVGFAVNIADDDAVATAFIFAVPPRNFSAETIKLGPQYSCMGSSHVPISAHVSPD
jgi:hypothetical protein